MDTTQTMVRMTLDRWQSLLKTFNDKLDALTDAQLEVEIAPGKNRGLYLLGHLAAVHDNMMPLLGFGDKLYPELYEPFINLPDKAVADLPAADELRQKWHRINQVLAENFDKLQPQDWFGPHTAVSDADFANEPHRNKLNIILTRASHLGYHLGQFILLR